MKGRRSWLVVTLLIAVVAGGLMPRVKAANNISFERSRMQDILSRVAKDIEKHYYDPKLKGLDWSALTSQAKERISKAESVGPMLTAIFSLVDKLQDSHTVFVPPGRKARIRFGFDAKPFGDRIFVYQVYKDRPALKAGLKEGDQILKVNGFDAQRATWMPMMRYMKRLQPVTTFELVIKRGSEAPQKIMIDGEIEEKATVARDLSGGDATDEYWREQEVEDEKDFREEEQFGKLFYSALYADGVGYLRFREFMTNLEFHDKLVDGIKDAKATVVDLRGNPGGDAKMLGYMADHFEEKPIVIADYVGRDVKEKIEASPRKPTLTGPLFILVDSESASAAEVFARHFQATGRAKIVGDHTPGWVEVSRDFHEKMGADTATLYSVQISIAKLTLTGGEHLEKVGVAPDVTCLPTPEDLRDRVDSCRKLAEKMARKALGLDENKEAAIVAETVGKR